MPDLLILCQLVYPELVSTGQTVTELAEELVRQGMSVEVIAGPMTVTDRRTQVPKRLHYRGITIQRVWGTRFSKLSLVGKLVNHLTYSMSVVWQLVRRRVDCPVLVFTNPPFLAVIAAVISLIRPIKMIYVIFDVYPETGIQAGVIAPNGGIARLWRMANQWCFHRATKIIVIGRCMETLIRSQLSPTDRAKLCRMHVWADDRQITPTADRGGTDRWSTGGKCVFGYSGNMGRFHDFDTLIRAAAQLDPDQTHCVFIGEGYAKSAIIRLAREVNLRCQFHSYVSREELGAVLGSFDVGLVTLKLGQEGLSVPSKTFGLMAAGLPIIAVMSDESEIARVIQDCGCGWVIRPGDVDRLVTVMMLASRMTPDDRRRMGAKGREFLDRQYSLTHAAATLKRWVIE